jgi:hypothetical protein
VLKCLPFTVFISGQSTNGTLLVISRHKLVDIHLHRSDRHTAARNSQLSCRPIGHRQHRPRTLPNPAHPPTRTSTHPPVDRRVPHGTRPVHVGVCGIAVKVRPVQRQAVAVYAGPQGGVAPEQAWGTVSQPGGCLSQLVIRSSRASRKGQPHRSWSLGPSWGCTAWRA